MSSTDEASVRFNEVSSQWDTKPSTLAATEAASSALRSMDWYVKAAADGGLRGMDFGCGTGLLTQRVIAGSDVVFSGGVVGVAVAEGMVDAFKDKLLEGRGHINSVKVTPITIDLAQTNLGL